MGDVTEGLIAGLIATIVITLVMFAMQAAHIAPSFDLIALIKVAATGDDTIFAWIVHFTMGVVVWGGLFAAFSPHVPGPHWLRGLLFGVIVWIAMMVAFLPAAGLSMFAMGEGAQIPMAALALCAIFGLALGESYHLLLHYMPGEADEELG
jgi:hypothetical protein